MKTQKTIENIRKCSLQNGNTSTKYFCVFKEIDNTNYCYINGIPKIVIKADVIVFKTKFNPKNILLKNMKFPKCFSDIYETVLNKYF